MKTNVGGWDRNVRWILGGGALVAGLMSLVRLPWRLALLAFGAIELFTAGARYCPFNEMLGLNTAGEGLEEEVRSTAQSLVE